MRKTITLLLTASIVAGAFAAPMADAAKRKKKIVKRKASAEYTTPAIALFLSTSGYNIGGASFPTGGSEKFVSVKLTDSSGQPVPGSIQQDLDGDLSSGESGELAYDFCGQTEEPVKIVPGSDVIVYVQVGPCGDGAGAGTQGTIDVTLQNRV